MRLFFSPALPARQIPLPEIKSPQAHLDKTYASLCEPVSGPRKGSRVDADQGSRSTVSRAREIERAWEIRHGKEETHEPLNG